VHYQISQKDKKLLGTNTITLEDARVLFTKSVKSKPSFYDQKIVSNLEQLGSAKELLETRRAAKALLIKKLEEDDYDEPEKRESDERKLTILKEEQIKATKRRIKKFEEREQMLRSKLEKYKQLIPLFEKLEPIKIKKKRKNSQKTQNRIGKSSQTFKKK